VRCVDTVRVCLPALLNRRASLVWETTWRSYSPSIVETASSVAVSAIPGSSSLVPNNVRNPSAALPQRARAWERSCRAASTVRP